MIQRSTVRQAHPVEILGHWHVRLATLADNDNSPAFDRRVALAAVLGLPTATTAAVAGLIRYLL